MTDIELEVEVEAPAPQAKCGCGCGQDVRKRFLPGHDARLKAELTRRALAGDAEAEKRMTRDLHWGAHLDKARKTAGAKAEAKAAHAAGQATRKASPPKRRGRKVAVPALAG